MAETLTTIPRAKLTVPRPKIRPETNSAEKLTVDFTAKKSPLSSGKLTVNASSYEAILEEMRPAHNEGVGTQSRLRNNKAQAELADAQEIVRRVGGRPSSQKPEKNRRKSRHNPQSSSEEDRTAQKRRAQTRDESEKTSEEEEETELGSLEFARALRNNPAQLAHLLRVLPPRDYQQLEARLVFWEKFEERQKNLASLAQEAAVTHASAQEKWDHARELLTQSLSSALSPQEYSLNETVQIVREVIEEAKKSRAREKDYLHARRVHLTTTFEEPSYKESQNAPEKTDREKNPLFGFAVRFDTGADKIAQKLLRIARK